MAHCSTPAIVLRRQSYGDFDVILTALTRQYGKQTLIAKAAKKSTKRFAGILEPFAWLQIVFRSGARGMPVLEEASLVRPFANIRSDIVKTAYASYWAELVAMWLEEGQVRTEIYELLAFSLETLSDAQMAPALLSVLFQMRFVGHEGLQPVLQHCTRCRADVNSLTQKQFCIDLKQGGVACRACLPQAEGHLHLSKGTLKQLQWVADGALSKAQRVRFGPTALDEATRFLEAFVPYHIGRMPKSLRFLQQIRG